MASIRLVCPLLALTVMFVDKCSTFPQHIDSSKLRRIEVAKFPSVDSEQADSFYGSSSAEDGSSAGFLETAKRLDPSNFHMGFGKRLDPSNFHMGFGKRLDPSNFHLGFGRKRLDPSNFHMGFGKRAIVPASFPMGFGRK